MTTLEHLNVEIRCLQEAVRCANSRIAKRKFYDHDLVTLRDFGQGKLHLLIKIRSTYIKQHVVRENGKVQLHVKKRNKRLAARSIPF